MQLNGINIGFAITGSFCTFDNVKKEVIHLVNEGANVIPIFSYNAMSIDTRFGKAFDFVSEIQKITSNEPVTSIEGAEPLGPKGMLDILIIAPCTGNTIAKLSNAITDTPVLMAAKAHMRNNKPLVISISTNDALGLNLKNIGGLLTAKGVYFVPFGQDNYSGKPKSMIADTTKIVATLEMALDGEQIQPILL
ncbi:dipicolinate synthase subunit B [Konateibacter massiliensis]|uniref:dipicolinate synthase subunit B n=1 Tax=Konateibacter massiliensis TaxID=2002841 RepID=UPI000C1605D3|nr:dipicolinate synthase subunit B [Konateibacter massiliensis]